MSKDTLKLILERLKPHREMAEWFLLMLDEVDYWDDELVTNLQNLITENIKRIQSKNQLKQISNELKTIKQKELDENQSNQKDIEELESLIDDIE